MRGISDYLREWGKTHPEFAREVVHELKEANCCQIRKEAFAVAYAFFADEKYLKEAKNDDAEMVRKWAQEIRTTEE